MTNRVLCQRAPWARNSRRKQGRTGRRGGGLGGCQTVPVLYLDPGFL